MIDQQILRREELAAFSLRSLYRQYGYLPYKMSKFEEYEYYIRNKDFLVSDRIITFTDTNGRLMALKPDVTLSIIKHYRENPGRKQKVCYNETIYRAAGGNRPYRELMQAGLECIGDIGLYDIFETLTLAARSLELIGSRFVLQISHMGLISAVLDQISADSDFRREVIACIAEKNAHDLARLCAGRNLPEESIRILAEVATVCGQRNQVLDRLETLCGGFAAKPLAELRELSALLDTLEYSDRIHFDFSVVHDMNYYSGIVFKGFLAGVSEGILAGGQYDRLMEKMGHRAGAIGFALYLDLLEQLPQTHQDYDVDVLLIARPEANPAQIARTVQAITAGGETVSVQAAIPDDLRFRRLVHCPKEDALC